MMEETPPSMLFALDRKKVFQAEVLKYVRSGHTYIEAILEFCDHHEIEPDMVSELIDRPMKENLEAEGIRLHMLPSKGHKPLDV